MMKKVIVLKDRYVDSVTLMSVGEKAGSLPGVEMADALMCSPSNAKMLTDMGFDLPEDIKSEDLVIVVSGETEEAVESAGKAAVDLIERGNTGSQTYRSLDDINLCGGGFRLAQISLPGEYAAAEARRALEIGLDVFMFSDNVSLSEERELKLLAREKGLLCMGPDCGVGLIDGVALAAGSIVRSGEVGIVGASGSGAQEIACIIEKLGYGVSSIIGTGGRDLYPEIGGITMMGGIERLSHDDKTKVILLVSKLADENVMDEVLKKAKTANKPVVAVFLGAGRELYEKNGVIGADNLEGAALAAVKLLGGKPDSFGFSDDEIKDIASAELKKYTPTQTYFRALYSGGTFAEEALIYFAEHNKSTVFHSNLKTKYAEKLLDSEKFIGHSVVDLGAPEFTKDTPHPVFDPAIRLKVFERELADESVACIALDFITGPGVHPNPAEDFARVYARSKKNITVIANICGSEGDPQNILNMETVLRVSGMIVTQSNYQSARLAGAIIAGLEGRKHS